jgi:hypothetical protein
LTWLHCVECGRSFTDIEKYRTHVHRSGWRERLGRWFRRNVVTEDPYYAWADDAIHHRDECGCPLQPYCHAHTRKGHMDHEHTTEYERGPG